ncbi:MAG: hypothetical protein ACJAV5_002125 [Vicingaceae bacterium]|jgi:hypothetical protein
MNKLSALLFIFGVLFCLQMSAQPNSWILNFGSVAKDQATAIAEDQSGDIITAGIIKDTSTFTWRGISYNMYPWRGDCFIAKQSAGGQLIWLRHIGGSGSIQVKDVATDVHDNFYITGLFIGTADFNPTSNSFNLISTDPQGDVFVAKYDNWGNFIWAKGIGGSGADYSSSIVLDQDSNIFIAGGFEGTVDFDPGPVIQQVSGNTVQDAFVLELDNTGNFKAVYHFGSAGMDFCTDLEIDHQGNLLISGSFESQVDFNPTNSIDTLTSSGLADAFILKLDSNLSFIWVKKIGGTGVDAILDLEIDDSGKIYLVGAFEGSCDFDPGAGVSQLMANNTDGFLLQLSSTGTYGWVNKLGGMGDDQVVGVAIDHLYKVHVTGYFSDTVDFDPDTSVSFNLVAQGNYDHYVYQLDTLGAFSWVQQFTGNTSSAANRIFVDQQDNLYTVGSFEGTIDFDPSGAADNRTAIRKNDIFVQRHTPTPLVSLLELIQGDNRSIKVYPNPSQERIRIDFEKEYKTVEMKVYDAQGRLRVERSYSNVQFIEGDVEEENGIYFIELLLNETERKTLKLVKS